MTARWWELCQLVSPRAMWCRWWRHIT